MSKTAKVDASTHLDRAADLLQKANKIAYWARIVTTVRELQRLEHFPVVNCTPWEREVEGWYALGMVKPGGWVRFTSSRKIFARQRLSSACLMPKMEVVPDKSVGEELRVLAGAGLTIRDGYIAGTTTTFRQLLDVLSRRD